METVLVLTPIFPHPCIALLFAQVNNVITATMFTGNYHKLRVNNAVLLKMPCSKMGRADSTYSLGATGTTSENLSWLCGGISHFSGLDRWAGNSLPGTKRDWTVRGWSLDSVEEMGDGRMTSCYPYRRTRPTPSRTHWQHWVAPSMKDCPTHAVGSRDTAVPSLLPLSRLYKNHIRTGVLTLKNGHSTRHLLNNIHAITHSHMWNNVHCHKNIAPS